MFQKSSTAIAPDNSASISGNALQASFSRSSSLQAPVSLKDTAQVVDLLEKLPQAELKLSIAVSAQELSANLAHGSYGPSYFREVGQQLSMLSKDSSLDGGLQRTLGYASKHALDFSRIDPKDHLLYISEYSFMRNSLEALHEQVNASAAVAA